MRKHAASIILIKICGNILLKLATRFLKKKGNEDLVQKIGKEEILTIQLIRLLHGIFNKGHRQIMRTN